MKNEYIGIDRYISLFETDMGWGAVVATPDGLAEILLPFSGNSREEMLKLTAEAYPDAVGDDPVTKQAAAGLARYFTGENVEFSFPLDLRRFTAFQYRVYQAVAGIPYGRVRTYAEIAEEVGRPGAARGIGQAMGRNPLPIIIPCHRVVGTSGRMTGYSAPGGVVSKQWLLRMEGVGLTERGTVVPLPFFSYADNMR